MNILMIITLTLLMGILGAGLWQQVESFDESVRFFCQYHERQMLVEYLLSYGSAIFCSDKHLRDVVYRYGQHTLRFNPWPRDGHYSAVLVMHRVSGGCTLDGEIYKGDVRVGLGHLRIVQDVDRKEFLLLRESS